MPKMLYGLVGEKNDKTDRNRQKLHIAHFLCFFYVIFSLHAKNYVCMSNGVTCEKDTKTKGGGGRL